MFYGMKHAKSESKSTQRSEQNTGGRQQMLVRYCLNEIIRTQAGCRSNQWLKRQNEL